MCACAKGVTGIATVVFTQEKPIVARRARRFLVIVYIQTIKQRYCSMVCIVVSLLVAYRYRQICQGLYSANYYNVSST